ncbi:MAG: GTPase HflX [Lachnospiraceae bacterium]|nr:GTPase HflX [Lachnospiraceae bacterium]
MKTIQGNIDGIRQSYIDRLATIYDMEVSRGQFCTQEILETLAFFTTVTKREAMVYIDRAGRIETVAVGEQDRVSIPAIRRRRSENRLSGLRCIHTHPGGNPMLSKVDIQTLKVLRLDAMAAVGCQDGSVTFMQVGVLNEPMGDTEYSVTLFDPMKADRIPDATLWKEINEADLRIRPSESKRADREIARTILVGIDSSKVEPLNELKHLADTAGFHTVGYMVQPKTKPDKTYYFGHGKLKELILEIQKLQADAVIFDDELTPSQIRNIQKELGKKIEIIDRTALILDIFSGRASTREGRLQVELAQAKYMLPRMTGFWTHLNRMGGGGGGSGGARRGEGETQLEVDKRLLRKRITELEREIDKVKSRRDIQRGQREKSQIPIVSLVGYTNAGKSTLMNVLSGSDVLAEDKLFATLDPVSRNVNYGSGEFLLVDTVGFINKLPHDLVNAFRATLEEVKYADLLLHIVDASSPEREYQMNVVDDVLIQLGANATPTLIVYNKSDIATETLYGGVSISAKTGQGLDKLQEAITNVLSDMRSEISVLLPLDAGALLSRIYVSGQVHACEYSENGIHLKATVSASDCEKIKNVALEIYG